MIELKKHHLRAAALCAGTKDIRPYLNGVLVERCSNGDIHIVGCDGHRAFVGRVLCPSGPLTRVDPVSCVITHDAIKAAAKGKGSVILEKGPEAYWKLGDMLFTPPAGVYPDWRRVIHMEHDPAQRNTFNAEYLLAGQNALRTWDGVKGDVHILDQAQGMCRQTGRNGDAMHIIMAVRAMSCTQSPPFTPTAFKE